MSRATMRDRAASLTAPGGSRSMVTVMILHDVDDVDPLKIARSSR
jgi:hypothetical protein